jgi:hypothetical protein
MMDDACGYGPTAAMLIGRRSLRGCNLMIWNAAIYCALVARNTVLVSLR